MDESILRRPLPGRWVPVWRPLASPRSFWQADSQAADDDIAMRSPIRPVPQVVLRWSGRARRLRWADGVLGWLAIWGGIVALQPAADAAALGVLAAVLVLPAIAFAPLRRRWRPVSAAVALVLSWRVRPGDRAWYVNTEGARLVLVTSRRWLHVVVAGVVQDSTEGITLRRTRGFLVPATGASSLKGA